VLVPLNYRLTSTEIDFLLQDAEPAVLIFEKQYTPIISALTYWKQCEHHLAIETLFSALCQPTASALTNWENNTVIAEDDPIFILYTSGTTGFPKGALYTHRMLFWNSINTALSLIVNAESRTVNVMPPFHTGGWNVLTTPFLHHGGYTCLVRKFEPETVLRLLAEEAVTVFMGVPTMLKMMADLPAFDAADFPALSYIIVGGEPMPIPLIEQWHEKQVPIRQGYGMTEVGPNLTSLHQADAIRKKGSIGRPNFYVETRIVDESGAVVQPNETGELLLRGPMVTPGYWRNAAATTKSLQDGWFRTGDLVSVDEEGYIYVVDRIKNMFISGGENVYPAEVERVLVQHPCVAEAAVVGMADPQWGEVGQAFVVLKEKQSANAEELKAFCLKNLAKFKIPKTFIFLPELPKNDTGKINRKVLRPD
jgi:fatty-acyl-CoA synthase